MPPRHAYWTILVDDQPTAFRAHDPEELLPTLNRLREKNETAVMKWFERGQLFESREAAREAGFGQGERRWEGPRPDRSEDGSRGGGDRAQSERPRDKNWRPGGEHRDPRQKYRDAKKAKWTRFKEKIRDRHENRIARDPESFTPPHGDKLQPREHFKGPRDPRWDDRPARGDRPRTERRDDRPEHRNTEFRENDFRNKDSRSNWSRPKEDRPTRPHGDTFRETFRDERPKPAWKNRDANEGWRQRPDRDVRRDNTRRDDSWRDDSRRDDSRRETRRDDTRRDERRYDDRRGEWKSKPAGGSGFKKKPFGSKPSGARKPWGSKPGGSARPSGPSRPGKFSRPPKGAFRPSSEGGRSRKPGPPRRRRDDDE